MNRAQNGAYQQQQNPTASRAPEAVAVGKLIAAVAADKEMSTKSKILLIVLLVLVVLLGSISGIFLPQKTDSVKVGQVECGKEDYQCKMVNRNQCKMVNRSECKMVETHKHDCNLIYGLSQWQGVQVLITTASGCTVTGKDKITGKRQSMSQLTINASDVVVMLVRKQSENAEDFFNKDLKEYQDGFASNGESWIGLDKLHQLTSERSYSLKITMTDYDKKTFVAVYNNFKVGPGENYVLTVESFNDTLSTLGNSMGIHSGQKFSTKDRDQDEAGSFHCPKELTGGFWYRDCYDAHPTGLSSAIKKNGSKYVTYKHGGERGDGFDSWSEAEYLLVPN